MTRTAIGGGVLAGATGGCDGLVPRSRHRIDVAG
jgi:hypothetical protein